MAPDRLEAEVQSYPAVLVEAEALVSVQVRLRAPASGLKLEGLIVRALEGVTVTRAAWVPGGWSELARWPSPEEPLSLRGGQEAYFAFCLHLPPQVYWADRLADFQLWGHDGRAQPISVGPLVAPATAPYGDTTSVKPPWLIGWYLGSLLRHGLTARDPEEAKRFFRAAEELAGVLGDGLLLRALRGAVRELALELPLRQDIREALAASPYAPRSLRAPDLPVTPLPPAPPPPVTPPPTRDANKPSPTFRPVWPSLGPWVLRFDPANPVIVPPIPVIVPPVIPPPPPSSGPLRLRLMNGQVVRWPASLPEPEGAARAGVELIALYGILNEAVLKSNLGEAGFRAFATYLAGLPEPACIVKEYSGLAHYRLNGEVTDAWELAGGVEP